MSKCTETVSSAHLVSSVVAVTYYTRLKPAHMSYGSSPRAIGHPWVQFVICLGCPISRNNCWVLKPKNQSKKSTQKTYITGKTLTWLPRSIQGAALFDGATLMLIKIWVFGLRGRPPNARIEFLVQLNLHS